MICNRVSQVFWVIRIASFDGGHVLEGMVKGVADAGPHRNGNPLPEIAHPVHGPDTEKWCVAIVDECHLGHGGIVDVYGGAVTCGGYSG